MVTTRPPKTIVKPTALGPVANTDTKLLIYGLFQKGRVLAQDGVAVPGGFRDAGASLPAVAPFPTAAHPEPAASRVSDVGWLHQIRVVLLLR